MAENPPQDESKLTRSKMRWASEGKFLTGATGSGRLPPGQHLVTNWPVLDLGSHPDIDRESWKLDISGFVQRPITLDWAEFSKLATEERVSDIHCVTTWSRFDNRWGGLPTRSLLDLVDPVDEAVAVMLHAYDGYTTNIPLEDFFSPQAMIVHQWEGQALPREHGGPARVVVPHLYFWKSAKWIREIEFLTCDCPGYWEENGYNMRGDPWTEQRYA